MATKTGNPASQSLAGSADGDWIVGGGGADSVTGLGGDDFLVGGYLSHNRFGNSGHGYVDADRGDLLDGGDGADTLYAGSGDTVIGGLGVDRAVIDLQSQTTGVHGDLTQLNGSGRAVLSDGTQIGSVEGGMILLGAGDDALTLDDSAWQVRGKDGSDTLTGGAANDTLDGGSGPDSLDGGAGNDLLIGGLGDTVQGGAGSDAFRLDVSKLIVSLLIDLSSLSTGHVDLAGGGTLDGVERVSVLAGSGDDTLIGSLSADVLNGGGGDDVLIGGGGLDTLNGGAGHDAASLDLSNVAGGMTANLAGLRGGGDILFTSSSGSAELLNVERLTSLVLGNGADNITMSGLDIAAQVLAGGGADQITVNNGTASRLVIDGGDGADVITVSGDLVGTSIDGGAGNDHILITPDVYRNSSIEGGGGNDTITFLTGSDGLEHDAGSPAPPAAPIHVGAGAGADRIQAGDGSYFLEGEGGDDTLIGGALDDTLDGGHDHNRLDGKGGADLFFAGDGQETILGGDGDDTLSFAHAHGPITAGAKHGGGTTGSGGTDTCSSLENLIGSEFGDVLSGSGLANRISGLQGDDTIMGGGGGDTLDGGSGADVLRGGKGADTFSFGPDAAGSTDLIADLKDSQDVIDVSGIDAVASTSKDDAFHLVAAFDGHAGELLLRSDPDHGRVTLVEWDTDGDGDADGSIRISGRHTDFQSFVL